MKTHIGMAVATGARTRERSEERSEQQRKAKDDGAGACRLLCQLPCVLLMTLTSFALALDDPLQDAVRVAQVESRESGSRLRCQCEESRQQQCRSSVQRCCGASRQRPLHASVSLVVALSWTHSLALALVDSQKDQVVRVAERIDRCVWRSDTVPLHTIHRHSLSRRV